MKEQKYNAYLKEIGKFIPKDRIYTDELRLLAWGTDAGFYRLIPKIVIRAKDENEVSRLLALADKYTLPVTFRAAGTSLSGQSISDSILIVAGKNWEKYSISEDFERITLQPGIIGARVNEILKPHGRKFAPDPASVKSAMVGGIVMNNASGMNCGTHANSDKELLSAKIVLADGTRLNTGDPESRTTFEKNHTPFLNKIIEIRDEIRNDNELSDRIRKKYSIKNVTGLNLLPFVIYDDPFDIIAHLMVGSEGTLAFLSEVTMKTEHDYPYSASAMLYFSNIKDACRAVVAMKPGPVFSAELLDKKVFGFGQRHDWNGSYSSFDRNESRYSRRATSQYRRNKKDTFSIRNRYSYSLYGQARRIFEILGYPFGYFPIGRRNSPTGYDRFDRRRCVSIERATRSDRRFTRVIGNE